MRWIVVFLLMFIVACESESDRQARVKEELMDRILHDVATQVSRTTGLHPFGTGGRAMYKVQMLALAFNCPAQVDVDTARKLVVHSAGLLIERVNADEKIRPFLGNYPFQSKNVEIRIFVSSPKQVGDSPTDLVVAKIVDGKIKYLADGPDRKSYTLLLEETYEQAVEKLKQQAA